MSSEAELATPTLLMSLRELKLSLLETRGKKLRCLYLDTMKSCLVGLLCVCEREECKWQRARGLGATHCNLSLGLGFRILILE